MKKNLIAFCCLLFAASSFGQLTSQEFKDLINKARLLKNAKDYKNAAIAYSLAIRTGGNFVNIDHRWSAACSWTNAGLPDSAFVQLDSITASPKLYFNFIFNLLSDNDCFLALHNDLRWKDFKRNILKIAGDGQEEFVKAIDFIKNKDYDSAFYHLNLAAVSKDLSFECAYYIIVNHYFLTDPENDKFENDKRFDELKNKIFTSLNVNNIPASAFSNTLKSPKRLMIDAGHYGYRIYSTWKNDEGSLRKNGIYTTLAGTLNKSGFEVSEFNGKFEIESLKNTDILFISNPLSDRTDSLFQRARRANQEFQYRWSDAAIQSAFTKAEISEIASWVKNGGSLFLILDHAPNGKAGEGLAAALGIENRNVGTYDTLSIDPISDTTDGTRNILFTRSKRRIGKHTIMNAVDSVTTYTGESLVGPAGSDALLLLSASAYDQDWLWDKMEYRYRSALGRAQAVAFEHGKGRVVMLGEAAITRPEYLSISNRGNWKFILNIFRWLAREKMD